MADGRKARLLLQTAAAVVVVLAGHGQALGGFIETATRFAVAADSDGTVRIRGTIRNTGNATAFSVRAAFVLLESVYGAQDVGNLSPGGAVAVDYTLPAPLLEPGHYILLVNVEFEERSGVRHAVHHVYPFDFALDAPGHRRPQLQVKLTNPRYNRRAWLNRPQKVRLILENPYSASIDAVVSLVVSPGMEATPQTVRLRLPPGYRKQGEFALKLRPSAIQAPQYGVLVHYRWNGRIHSFWLDAGIEVVERPFVFALYTAAAAVFLLMLGIRTALRTRSVHRIWPSRR